MAKRSVVISSVTLMTVAFLLYACSTEAAPSPQSIHSNRRTPLLSPGSFSFTAPNNSSSHLAGVPEGVFKRPLQLRKSPIISTEQFPNTEAFLQADSERTIFIAKNSNNLMRQSSRQSNAGTRNRSARAQEDPLVYSSFLKDSSNYAQVDWLGVGSKVILVLTYNFTQITLSWRSNLYRSDDYGKTFVNQASVLPSTATILNYHIDANFPGRIMLFDAFLNVTYMSIDEGATYTARNLPFYPTFAVFHPENAEAILGFDGRTPVASSSSLAGRLFVSKDFAAQWSLVAVNVVQYGWGNSYDPNQGTIYYRTSERMAYKSIDYGLTSSLFMSNVSSISISDQYLFAFTTPLSIFRPGLQVSYLRQPFVTASFPVNATSFQVVDTSENQVFVAIEYVGEATHWSGTRYASLCISDITGSVYTLSLQDVVYYSYSISGGIIDFVPVAGIHGVYLASFFQDYKTNDFLYRSTITFDKGGNWHLLAPPKVDVDGETIDCIAPSCSLHIHGYISSTYFSITPIFSRRSTVGIIIASGSIGEELYSDVEDVFISRDAGLSWKMILKGPHLFAFSNRGSVIVAAKSDDKVTSIFYSLNEGDSFTQLDIFPDPVYVAGILTEPGELSTEFSFYVYDDVLFEWIIVQVDFKPTLGSACTDADYEQWRATDPNNGNPCILGATKVYLRKKQNVICYNDENEEAVVSKEICECSREDFECDFGYEEAGINSVCVPIPGFDPTTVIPVNCVEGAMYNASKGYRKIAGDVCVGGEEASFSPTPTPCPLLPVKNVSVGKPFVLPAKTGTSLTFTATVGQGSSLSLSFLWDFGDGSAAFNTTSGVVTHTYNFGGNFTVRVLAANFAGEDTAATSVEIQDVLELTSIEFGQVAQNVESVFTATHDPSKYFGKCSYAWDFGDGSGPIASFLPTIRHTYKSMGTYTISVTASNSVSSVTYDALVTVEEASTSSQSDGLSRSAVAGIVIPTILVAFLLAFSVYYYRKKYRETSIRYSNLQNEVAPDDRAVRYRHGDTFEGASDQTADEVRFGVVPASSTPVGLKPMSPGSNILRLRDDDDDELVL